MLHDAGVKITCHAGVKSAGLARDNVYPTSALKNARGRFTVVGMTVVPGIAEIAVIARHRRYRKTKTVNHRGHRETQRNPEESESDYDVGRG